MSGKHYVSFKHYMAIFDADRQSFTFINERFGARVEMKLDGLFVGGERKIAFEDFSSCKVTRAPGDRVRSISVVYGHDTEDVKPLLRVAVDAEGITFVAAELDFYEFRASGHLYMGEGETSRSVALRDNSETAFRAAIGPATSKGDNAIFDGKRDAALVFDNCKKLRISYDWDKGAYSFSLKTKTEGVAEYMRIFVRENILADAFAMDYAPLRARGKFEKPPAGWMTWYAVKFGACEESVLRNLAFQRDNLKEFGADTVWVDWEWCHRAYEKERDDGVNNLSPDMKKYPNGLGYISDKIKEAGFNSAIWIGATNDISFSDFEAEHPDVSLAHNETWSGMYYYDITSDAYLNGYLPRAMGQLKEWGYDAVKFDTLPNCMNAHEQFHQNMAHPELTTYTAYRNMLERTREILGEDTFMLGCGGSSGCALAGVGYFDSTRVGPDLFTWDKLCETVGLVREYYPLHNNAIMVDADNVVLRDEYSTMAEARSRLCLVSLLGLPITFGDDLPALQPERIDILKRGLPVMKTYPASLACPICDGKTQLSVLKIAKSYEDYTVIGLLNMSDKSVTRELGFATELRVESGDYIAYSFFEEREIYPSDDSITLTVAPHDTAVVALRRKTGKPQLLSTSRHLTQGAAEISEVSYAEGKLSIRASLIGGDEYRVAIYVPSGYECTGASLGEYEQKGEILRLKYMPKQTGEYQFEVSFGRA